MAKRISRRRHKLLAPRGFEVLPSDGRRFMVLRLRSGRRVVQRTFTSSEVDFLVWTLAWVSWNSDEAKTPGQALLLAFERGRGRLHVDPWDLHSRAMGRVSLGELFCRAQAL